MKLDHYPLVTLLVMGVLYVFAPLKAQETAALSPWAISLDIATQLDIGATFDSIQDFRAEKTYGRLGIKAAYRGSRWISLAGQAHFHRGALTYQRVSFSDVVNGERYAYGFYHKYNAVSFSVGPEFMVRIGQGDLTLGIKFGAALNFAKAEAIRHDGMVLDFTYKPVIHRLSQIALGYTYWPTSRLGVSATFDIQNMGTNVSRSQNFFSPQKITSSSEMPVEEISGLNFLYPSLNILDTQYLFALGFHYRLAR